ncbi:19126_t:CDS:10 [Funneliformis geosporum]|uniref:17997_t:CDS:1 n=1 Tax=Funneliformis geosporum TaxID=1117311 RepID=A0A9W4SXD9_9GLOM|nr:19126_t:CDS:10 [Funneliformis geosporum]CAI2185001.1 17997_t:CDS:10 [Funneliformis geosporum]
MRSICLVERVKWKFGGNMNPHAFGFGDVDNDEDNEFVIGNLKGELAVFKGISVCGEPYMICNGLGTITCLAIGDIKNSGKNSIVCVNAEGQCHIFDVAPSNELIPIVDNENTTTSSKKSNDSQNSTMRPIINVNPLIIEKPTMTLPVPVNCNRILIADIDGDGINEVILARTDRILHVLRFQKLSIDNIKSLTKEQQNILARSNMMTDLASEMANSKDKEKKGANIVMHLVEKKKLFFDGQITSLSTAKDPITSSPLLLVGQPGGHLIIIDKNEKKTFPTQVSDNPESCDELTEVSTEIVSGIRFKNGERLDVVAIITMDGKFTLYDLQNSSMRHHELRVTHKLFGMAAMNLCINGDKKCLDEPEKLGDDIFVTCAWNGNTYMIDHDFNVVKFEFETRVCAFAAGQYAIAPGHNVNCFMYVDFEDRITVYYNLRINTKPVTNFTEIMNGQFNQFDELLRNKIPDYDQEKKALSNGQNQSVYNITEFFHQCLYQLDDYKNMKAKLQREIEELKKQKREEYEKEQNELREKNVPTESDKLGSADESESLNEEQSRNHQHESSSISEQEECTFNILQDVEKREIENE